ncbi:MAG: HD domain-containing phosphohydrolase [Candidatus Hydrogenedentota bacterium]
MFFEEGGLHCMKIKIIFIIVFLFTIFTVSFSLLSLTFSENSYVRLGLIFVGVALSGFIAIYIVKHFVKPVRALEENIKNIEKGEFEAVANTGSTETDNITQSYKQALSRLKDLRSLDEEIVTKRKTFVDALFEIKEATTLSFSQEISKNPAIFCNINLFYETIKHKLESVLKVDELIIYLYDKEKLDPVWWVAYKDKPLPFIPPPDFIEALSNKEDIIINYRKKIEHNFLPVFKDYNISIWIPVVFEKSFIGFVTLLIVDETSIPLPIKNFLISFGKEIGVCYRLFQEYEILREHYKKSVKALADIWEIWHPYTRGHAEGVEKLALKIADRLGLSVEDKYILTLAAYLHDIGELGIPDSILHKESPLTDIEIKSIQTHPLLSIEIIQKAELRKKILDVVEHHHEHFDGSGYPNKVAGEKIPLLSRILSVCDAFQAIISTRPYRTTIMTREEAVYEIQKNSGTQFDPKVVDVFMQVLAEGY